MLTLALLAVAAAVVFCIALVSPRKGTRIQRKLAHKAGKVDHRFRSKPKAVQFLVRKPASTTHRVLHHSAQLGKKGHRKITK